MTWREYLKKWSAYAAALFFFLALELLVFNRFRVWGVMPVLLPLVVTAVAIFEGAANGARFGLAAGILYDAALSDTTRGRYIVLLTVGGLLAGLVAEFVLSRNLLSCLACSAGMLLWLDLFRVAIRLFFRHIPLLPMLRLAAREAAYSLFFVIPVYLVVRRIYDRVGGTKLA